MKPMTALFSIFAGLALTGAAIVCQADARPHQPNGGSYVEKYNFNHSTGQGFIECASPNPQTGHCSCPPGFYAVGGPPPGYPSAPPVRYQCEPRG